MKLLRREWVDAVVDRARFELDKRPSLDYQPLPWLGIEKARRDAGVATRWDQIAKAATVSEARTALDIGSNAGFFPLSLGHMGVHAVGVERDPKLVRLFLYAIKRSKLANVGALSLSVTPDSVSLLPTADLVIFVSVWHHFARHYGLGAATEMLRVVWSKTGKAMVFETGEKEMPACYNLPDFGDDPEAVIRVFLLRHCEGSSVEHLGRHDAFAPDQSRHLRNLFLVRREATEA